jgi:formylmethanofuran dehydrogenase subunit B
LEAAIAEAARLIAQSRALVIAGLGADVAGARAAVSLADRVGAAIDHMHSSALLRDLDVMREYGVMLTTPNEARLRGDVVFLVGDGLSDAGLPEVWPDLRTHALASPAAAGARRRILWLCPGDTARRGPLGVDRGGGVEIETVSGDAEALPGMLAALRARVNGRPFALTGAGLREIDGLATALQSATFGVAVWCAARLDALTIEMLSGLVADLNARTRFTGLPLAPGDNAAGVLQVCGWMTGFPMRTGFARGFPEHDPWRFEADRLVNSGEADCALWISAYQAASPQWERVVPLIALTGARTEFARTPEVLIAVGRPGVDHGGVDHLARTATLAPLAASQASDAPSVADVIGRLVAALDGQAGAAAC